MGKSHRLFIYCENISVSPAHYATYYTNGKNVKLITNLLNTNEPEMEENIKQTNKKIQ